MRVARVLLNGRELKEPFIRQSDVMSGGTLRFEMAP
jgi:putative alpha-1,2-mannosidase